MKKNFIAIMLLIAALNLSIFGTIASVSAEEDTDTATTSTVTATGSDVVAYAVQFVGNPYVWGGTSLTNGADCSGFVLAVYEHFGISLPHYSGSQFSCGTAVDASELTAGDLVFYGAGGSQHVALYIGNGQVVHAVNSATGIAITSIDYCGTPSGYRRLL